METTNELKANLGHLRDNVKSSVKQNYRAAQDKAREAVASSEEFVKEHPYYTILGAATIGFVAGVLLRRNRH